jgi:ankyrin repeat protein
VSCGHPEIAAELVKRGALVETVDKMGRNALHKASNAGDVNSMKVVLSKHGDINVRDKTGVTPLHLAAAHGHTGIAQVLLKHRALVDLEDSKVCALALSSVGFCPAA